MDSWGGLVTWPIMAAGLLLAGAGERIAMTWLAILLLAGSSLQNPPQKKAPAPKPAVAAAAGDAVQQAEDKLGHGQYAAAATLLEHYLAGHASDAHAHCDLGYAWAALGRRDDAIREYTTGVAGQPNDFSAQMNLSLLLLQAHQPATALPHLQQAAQLKPGDAKVWMNQGEALEALGRNQDALAAFRKAAALDPASVTPHKAMARLLVSARQWAQAEPELQAVLKAEPEDEAARSALINAYLQQHQFDKAQPLLQTLLQQHPDSAPGHFASAELLQQAGKLDQAQGEYQKALQLDPSNDEARAQLAQIAMLQKNYAAAIQMLQPLAAKHPQSADWHMRLGTAYMQAMQMEPARDQFLAVVSQRPQAAEAWGDLAVVFYKLKDPVHSLAALDRHDRLAGNSAGSYFLRAINYDQLQQYDLAVENYQKFLQVDQHRDPDDEFKATHRLIAIQPLARRQRKKK